MLRIAVLISGNGSNLQAIIDCIEQHHWPITISLVISNKPEAYGLQRANQHGIDTAVLSHQDYPSRESYDAALAKIINQHAIDLIVLAGFMRILSEDFVNQYQGKLINIHPSLLPKYRGLHTHRRVIENNETHHGTSVHFVTPELDGGPIISQAQCPIEPNDTPETLQQRVQQLEYQLYPTVIHWFAQDRLHLKDKTVYLDDQPLPAYGYLFSLEENRVT